MRSFETSPQFNEEEKLVLQLAVALTRTSDVHDDLYEGLRRCFSERKQVDLNAVIPWEKFLSANHCTFAIEVEPSPRANFVCCPSYSCTGVPSEITSIRAPR
jgi:hypothetical protein